MKIFLNLLIIAIIVLVLIILTQNADQSVDVEVLTYGQTGINLVFVMIISFTVGAMFGAAFMAFSAIQAKAKVREIQRQNKTLTIELEKLRNISIDEIPEQDEVKKESERG
jgi:uncharacterized membrane protein YciS (DUF1049 family)